MKKDIAILALIGALIYGTAAYTRPESTPGQYLHNTIDPAVSGAVKSFQQLPFVRLLDWDGVNDYQPRPTLRPLKVVPDTDTPYTAEELAEIYPTH